MDFNGAFGRTAGMMDSSKGAAGMWQPKPETNKLHIDAYPTIKLKRTEHVAAYTHKS